MCRKSFSKSERKRLHDIAQGMIWDADKYSIKNAELDHAKERFAKAKEIVP